MSSDDDEDLSIADEEGDEPRRKGVKIEGREPKESLYDTCCRIRTFHAVRAICKLVKDFDKCTKDKKERFFFQTLNQHLQAAFEELLTFEARKPSNAVEDKAKLLSRLPKTIQDEILHILEEPDIVLKSSWQASFGELIEKYSPHIQLVFPGKKSPIIKTERIVNKRKSTPTSTPTPSTPNPTPSTPNSTATSPPTTPPTSPLTSPLTSPSTLGRITRSRARNSKAASLSLPLRKRVKLKTEPTSDISPPETTYPKPLNGSTPVPVVSASTPQSTPTLTSQSTSVQTSAPTVVSASATVTTSSLTSAKPTASGSALLSGFASVPATGSATGPAMAPTIKPYTTIKPVSSLISSSTASESRFSTSATILDSLSHLEIKPKAESSSRKTLAEIKQADVVGSVYEKKGKEEAKEEKEAIVNFWDRIPSPPPLINIERNLPKFRLRLPSDHYQHVQEMKILETKSVELPDQPRWDEHLGTRKRNERREKDILRLWIKQQSAPLYSNEIDSKTEELSKTDELSKTNELSKETAREEIKGRTVKKTLRNLTRRPRYPIPSNIHQHTLPSVGETQGVGAAGGRRRRVRKLQHFEPEEEDIVLDIKPDFTPLIIQMYNIDPYCHGFEEMARDMNTTPENLRKWIRKQLRTLPEKKRQRRKIQQPKTNAKPKPKPKSKSKPKPRSKPRARPKQAKPRQERNSKVRQHPTRYEPQLQRQVGYDKEAQSLVPVGGRMNGAMQAKTVAKVPPIRIPPVQVPPPEQKIPLPDISFPEPESKLSSNTPKRQNPATPSRDSKRSRTTHGDHDRNMRGGSNLHTGQDQGQRHRAPKRGLCRYFMKGRCINGDTCIYVHDMDNRDWRNDQVCHYHRFGKCDQGDLCLYSHDMKLLPCTHYNNARFGLGEDCKLGDECRYSHEDIPQETFIQYISEERRKRQMRPQRRYTPKSAPGRMSGRHQTGGSFTPTTGFGSGSIFDRKENNGEDDGEDSSSSTNTKGSLPFSPSSLSSNSSSSSLRSPTQLLSDDARTRTQNEVNQTRGLTARTVQKSPVVTTTAASFQPRRSPTSSPNVEDKSASSSLSDLLGRSSLWKP